MEEEQSTETSEEFLVGVSERLHAGPDTDIDLADILKVHILQTAPANDAVVKAKAAIIELAQKRAATAAPDNADD